MASPLDRQPRWLWVFVGAVGLLALMASRVEVSNPRIHVRWQDGLSADARAYLERRFDLREGELVGDSTTTWQYRLGNRRTENVGALVGHQAVLDTSYIDRTTFAVEPGEVRLRWYPLSDLYSRPSDLLQLHQSVWLLLAGGAVCWAAGAARQHVRRSVSVAALLFVGVMAYAFPIDPTFVHMGGSEDRLKNRENFEFFYDGRVRFEKHLSQVALLQLYRRDAGEASPARAMVTFTRGVTAWCLLSALAIGLLERWSPRVVRYIGLALLAPLMLLYFGWRELGYVSLNLAVFPLLALGLRDDGPRIEGGAAMMGLGAALHGSGLVAFGGAVLAAFGASGAVEARLRRVLRVGAWGTAAYLGWILLYMLVLELPISPDPGPAQLAPWRPWFASEIRGGRAFAAAIVSAAGLRDIAMSLWMVGAPLGVVALSSWRPRLVEMRVALWYAVPSLVFVICRWPSDGIGQGVDLVVAGFPAFYAFAWICADSARRTTVAAVLLASGHYAFWRALLDERFLP